MMVRWPRRCACRQRRAGYRRQPGHRLGDCAPAGPHGRARLHLREESVEARSSRRRIFALRVSRRLALQADVTRADQISALVHKTQDTLGPIDILVNNAGIGVFGAFQERAKQTGTPLLDTNLKSVFLVSRAVAPEMIRRKTGHIINISSLAGKNTFANGAIYCASKWGLMGLTGCMAEDLRAHGIRVSAVCPGSVATDFSGQSAKDPAKMLQPDDVAHAVAALVTQAPGSFISEVHMRPTRKP